jgi:hypothetical protein
VIVSRNASRIYIITYYEIDYHSLIFTVCKEAEKYFRNCKITVTTPTQIIKGSPDNGQKQLMLKQDNLVIYFKRVRKGK